MPNYGWCHRGSAEVIDHQVGLLCHRMNGLFSESRDSLGSQQMMKQLRKEGFQVGRYRVRKLMKRLGLVVKRKKRFVLTTDSKHTYPVAENQLNRNFNWPNGAFSNWQSHCRPLRSNSSLTPDTVLLGNAVVEKINVLIEQRCALTIRKLTDPAAEPSV